ncbi:hypothetical protein LTR66_017889, partial [Elasticomyces elasticus]
RAVLGHGNRALWLRPGHDVPNQHKLRLPLHHGHHGGRPARRAHRLRLLSRLRPWRRPLLLARRQLRPQARPVG